MFKLSKGKLMCLTIRNNCVLPGAGFNEESWSLAWSLGFAMRPSLACLHPCAAGTRGALSLQTALPKELFPQEFLPLQRHHPGGFAQKKAHKPQRKFSPCTQQCYCSPGLPGSGCSGCLLCIWHLECAAPDANSQQLLRRRIFSSA